MAPSQRQFRMRRSRRRDTETLRRTTIKGLIVLALFGLFMYVGLSSYNGVPLTHYSKVNVDVPEIGNLIRHDPVRVAGVRVGQVTSETVTSKGQARITLQINPGTQLPDGTQAMVRANGLLGARYVQLIPSNSKKMLRSGATISANADDYTYGVPELLNTFDQKTRATLAQMIDGLGTGVLGHGAQLNTVINEFPTGLKSFTAIANAVLAPPGSASRLVPSVNATMALLEQNRRQIANLLEPAARALEPLVTDRSQVRAILTAAPSTLTRAQSGLSTGEELLDSATALAEAGERTLPDLPAGLKNATTLLADAPLPLNRADVLLKEAQPAIPATLRITAALNPVLHPLGTALTRVQPILNYAGPRACDIINFGVVMRSMTGFGGDGTGPLGDPMEFRGQAIPGPEALAPIGALDPDEHDAYAAPCKYVDRPASEDPTIGGPQG